MGPHPLASAGSSSNRSYELTRLRWFPLTGPAVYIPNLWATWRPWSSILRRVNPSTIAGELRTFQFVANPPCFGDSILTCSRILQVCRHSGVTRVQTREELWTTNTRASFLTTNEASCTPRSSPAASFIWSVWELAGTFILLLDNLLGSLLRS